MRKVTLYGTKDEKAIFYKEGTTRELQHKYKIGKMVEVILNHHPIKIIIAAMSIE